MTNLETTFSGLFSRNEKKLNILLFPRNLFFVLFRIRNETETFPFLRPIPIQSSWSSPESIIRNVSIWNLVESFRDKSGWFICTRVTEGTFFGGSGRCRRHRSSSSYFCSPSSFLSFSSSLVCLIFLFLLLSSYSSFPLCTCCILHAASCRLESAHLHQHVRSSRWGDQNYSSIK